MRVFFAKRKNTKKKRHSASIPSLFQQQDVSHNTENKGCSCEAYPLKATGKRTGKCFARKRYPYLLVRFF